MPDKAQRGLRELVGYRRSLARDKAAGPNRHQKMLEGADIKLSGTVADINGKSARSILDAVQSGEEATAARLGEMRGKRLVAANLKATDAQLTDGLNGAITPLQRKMMKVLRSHIDGLDRHITGLGDEIGRNMKDGVVFKDLGAGYYNQFNRERKVNSYLKKLKALGWEGPVAMGDSPLNYMVRFQSPKKLDRGSLRFFS